MKLLELNQFKVLFRKDLHRSDFLDTLEQFRRDYVDGASEAFVFYSGHGMAIGGDDYLAPVDMSFSCEHEDAVRTVTFQQLSWAIQGVERQIIVLDACRNNPFRLCAARGAGQGKGFIALGAIGDETRLTVNSTSLGVLIHPALPVTRERLLPAAPTIAWKGSKGFTI